jgi:hypothetical protein
MDILTSSIETTRFEGRAAAAGRRTTTNWRYKSAPHQALPVLDVIGWVEHGFLPVA